MGYFSRWRTKPFPESLTQYWKHPVPLIKQDTGDSHALSRWQSAVSNTAVLVTLSHSRTGPCHGPANDRKCVCVSLSIWPTFSCHPFSDSNEAFPRDNALKHSRSEWKPRKGKRSAEDSIETQTNQRIQKTCVSQTSLVYSYSWSTCLTDPGPPTESRQAQERVGQRELMSYSRNAVTRWDESGWGTFIDIECCSDYVSSIKPQKLASPWFPHQKSNRIFPLSFGLLHKISIIL